MTAEADVCNAAIDGETETLEQLLDDGAAVESTLNGWSALLAAVSGAHEEGVALLLERGAAVDATNPQGHGCLHICIDTAAWRLDRMAPSGGFNDETHGRCRRIMKQLLDAGANANPPKPDTGEPPLMDAASHGLPDLTRLLCMHGARLEIRAADKRTPVMAAAARGHATTVDALLGLGADGNAEWNHGFRPIHFAAEAGEPAVAMALGDGGVDIGARLTGSFEGFQLNDNARAIAVRRNQKKFVAWWDTL